MNDEPKKKSRFRGLMWVLIMMPLLYVLSMGPAGMIYKRLQSESQFIYWFYAPVIWLHENTPLRKPLEMYLELWW